MEQEHNYHLGFNSGFLLAKYKRALVTKLTQSIRCTSAYLQGLSDGKAEYDKSMQQEKLKELESLRTWDRGGYGPLD
ncbi:MAG: hypothetical protein JNM95_02505 [Chitinophagaceae bacterium]|nr:hypothetical protein [Chitinophagaceae bacterium]